MSLVPPPFGLSVLVTQYFPTVIAIVGTISVALGGLSKFKEKRQADLIEATTTWRELAESRQALLEEARLDHTRSEKSLFAAHEREALLWEYASKLQSKLPAEEQALVPPPFARGREE